ncbi:MAG: hypothetical protein U1F43_19885 [Myxococcota bacterium]
MKRAVKAGKRLVAEDMDWTRPMGELLLGMAALAPDGRARAAGAAAARAEGLALLERAAEGFRAADMELHRLAVEHALGLAAGPDGEERRQLAAVATRALGVVEPARFLNAFTGCSPLH